MSTWRCCLSCHHLLLSRVVYYFDAVAAVVAVLYGSLSGNASVVEHGLRAIANLAEDSDENRWTFGTTGGCEG